MNYARKIVAACALSRQAWDTVRSCVDEGALGPIYAPVLSAITDYYERDTKALAVDTDLLTQRISGGQPGDKRARTMRGVLEEIWAEAVSPVNVADYVRDHALDTAGMRLASAVAARRGREEVDRLVRAYTTLLDAPNASDEVEESVRWRDVLRERLDVTKRIRISPPCLNERLGGGVYPGNNIVLFGRPEVGKSAAALTIACGFARRGLRGLYLGNEDPVASMMVRAATNLTMLSEEELSKDPDAGERAALAKGAANIVFRDMSPGTPLEIERLITLHKPQFLVLDQLRNIKIRDADGSTVALDQAAQFVRAMGKKHGIVTIPVTQAGDSAANKLVLSMSDVDGSKTGIPGSADVLLGIGMTPALEASGQRMMTLCKNKVSARHEHWAVGIDKFHSKYVSIK